jgi:hypothetical protein
MISKVLKLTGKVTLGVADFLLSDSDNNDSQLDQLNDGMGNIIADGEHMTKSEAEAAQSRGELYNTHN